MNSETAVPGFNATVIKEDKFPCVWTEDEEGCWGTDCGEYYVINDGTPEQNGMNYCCYCGKRLQQKPYEELRFEE